MEKTKDQQSNFLIVCLILGLVVGQSTASLNSTGSIKTSYKSCFILCLAGGSNVYSCRARCLINSISTASWHNNLNENTHDFCKLGCASYWCTKLSTKENPAEDKVQNCVDSCSKICARI